MQITEKLKTGNFCLDSNKILIDKNLVFINKINKMLLQCLILVLNFQKIYLIIGEL